ncbi:MAG: hypothetical protein J1F02_04835 [Lachnospiraceae bacterium]|nr:hypothetical protein [Lachnospiraceae bacterium]
MIDVCLLYPEKGKTASRGYGLPGDLVKDLNLSVILSAMAEKDECIYSVCQSVLLNPIREEEILKFRQQMVLDACENPAFYEGAYQLASRAMRDFEKNKNQGQKNHQERSKTQQIYDSLQMLLVQVKYLEQLKEFMRTEATERTDGVASLAKKLREFYSDEFAEELRNLVENMAFLLEGGRLVLTAGVGGGMKCADVVVNRLEPVDYREMGRVRRALRFLMIRFFSPEAIRLNATVLKQEAAQMETNGLHYTLQNYQKFIQEFQDFFEQFRNETGFYVGCATLYRKLSNLQMKVSYPRVSREPGQYDCRNLYELSMALGTLKNPVPNSFSDDCRLHVISGANQGGKSTFLRSFGIAQVMMQAGLFVPADYFVSSLYDNILTHFTRREDSSMNSGRLVEEMKRMNRIVDMITSRSLLLFNESFSSTTEKEGGRIAESIIQAMYDSGVTVFMVTHLFAFANSMYEKKLEKMRFMSAERKADGTRTFKIIDHEPTETSYGLDLYAELIGEPGAEVY